MGSRAFVIHVEPKNRSRKDEALRDAQARLDEAVGLTAAIHLNVVVAEIAPLARPTPATLLGTGKVEEIAVLARAEEPDVIIVNAHLSPVQQRNLEKAWNSKVLDRTAVILEIFGERAATREGRLQVELAHLNYQRSRLVRSWTHLERQRGGFGFLGGPGESQIESDRRLIAERIVRIKAELEKVKQTRGLGRQHLLQGGAEGGHQFGRQVGDKPHCVGQDDAGALRQLYPPHGGVQGGEQQVFGQDL